MFRIGISLALFVFSAGLVSAQTAQLARKNGWLDDYTKARAEARRTGKPIFLVFRCEP